MNALKFIGQALFTVIVAVTASWAFYNYAPVSIFHATSAPKAGAAFTTLAGSNTISAFPTTYNANLTITANTSAANTFTGLQTDAAGFVSQASSTVVGNFTSTGAGIFSSLTPTNALAVQYGGTGSTTLSQYAVLLGSTTNAVGMVQGQGSSGQFLTSNGAGVAPSWTSSTLNTALNFNWTGINLFKNFSASSTAANPITLNGLTFNTPALRAASSTALEEDGSGDLTFQLPQVSTLSVKPSILSVTSGTATTSLLTITLPANTLNSVGRLLRGEYIFQSLNTCYPEIDFGTGSATTSLGGESSGFAGLQQFSFIIDATSSTAEVSTVITSGNPSAGGNGPNSVLTMSTINIANQSYISIAGKCTSGSMILQGGYTQLLSN